VYVPRQTTFFDKRVRPHFLQQLLLINYVKSVLDEDQKSLESFRSEPNRDAVPEQDAAARVEDKRPEFI
jgi:hypothetical protein